MRKVLVLVMALVFAIPTAVLAQQTFSVFLTDINQTSDRVNPWPGGFGVSFERMFAERLSLQGAVAYERHRTYTYVVEDNGSITPVPRENLRTLPIEVTARYHWLNDTRFKPYLGLGVHYVAAPNTDARFRYQDHVDGLVGGGFVFMLKPSLGLLLEGRAIVGDREPYDPPFKVAAGVSWRF